MGLTSFRVGNGSKPLGLKHVQNWFHLKPSSPTSLIVFFKAEDVLLQLSQYKLGDFLEVNLQQVSENFIFWTKIEVFCVIFRS